MKRLEFHSQAHIISTFTLLEHARVKWKDQARNLHLHTL